MLQQNVSIIFNINNSSINKKDTNKISACIKYIPTVCIASFSALSQLFGR